jgi:hypothetical protein
LLVVRIYRLEQFAKRAPLQHSALW